MTQRHGARAAEERAHRQLQPADVHNRGSGASPLHLCPDKDQVEAVRTEPPGAVTGLPGSAEPCKTPGATSLHSSPAADDESLTPSWVKRRVLLLNATYEPLTALSVRRAVVLLVCEKAHAVHDDPAGPVLHSAGNSVAVPSVIRLHNYVRVPYRARVPMTRAALMHRDRFRCGYCGAKAETIDHVIPRSRGGEHSWENCVASCAPCNHRKADKLLAELGWTLRSPLVPPKGQHWRLLATTKVLDPVWLRYLGEGAA